MDGVTNHYMGSIRQDLIRRELLVTNRMFQERDRKPTHDSARSDNSD